MRELCFSKSIAELRKKAGVTQEELAAALHISSQAVSKWETGVNQPDTQTLAALADYFRVSIDYLYYGEPLVCDDLYLQATETVAAHGMMSREAYETALRLFAAAHHGISQCNLVNDGDFLYETPAHISNENGLSLLSGRGYGAIVTRAFFTHITAETLSFSEGLLKTLASPNALRVLAAVIGMSDISCYELREKLPTLKEEELNEALDTLKNARLLKEKESKHKALGKTYTVHEMYHTCLCILLATLEMQRFSLGGVACCMGPEDYPIPPEADPAPAKTSE